MSMSASGGMSMQAYPDMGMIEDVTKVVAGVAIAGAFQEVSEAMGGQAIPDWVFGLGVAALAFVADQEEAAIGGALWMFLQLGQSLLEDEPINN